jgi:hypothetical protein
MWPNTEQGFDDLEGCYRWLEILAGRNSASTASREPDSSPGSPLSIESPDTPLTEFPTEPLSILTGCGFVAITSPVQPESQAVRCY